jgi:hypothetical protein
MASAARLRLQLFEVRIHHTRLSSSAKADDPVRLGFPALSLTPVEYWIARFRGRRRLMVGLRCHGAQSRDP